MCVAGGTLIIVLMVSIMSCLSLTLFYHRTQRLKSFLYLNQEWTLSDSKLERSQACIHPKMELWHPSVKRFFHDVPQISCSKNKDWVYVDLGRFKLNPNVQKAFHDIKCILMPLVLKNDHTVETGNEITVQDGDLIPSDFFEVNCTSETASKTYTNVHVGIAQNESLQNRFKNMKLRHDGDTLNILMFGFDSMSRMTYMRNLPKSYKYLTEVLGATVLEGYNIVGDGTPQALLPILTGMTEIELPEARRGFSGAKQVDGHPWIWNDLKRIGYVTQWGEDGVNFGTFQYRMLGFKNQPVDHYLRTFYLHAQKTYKRYKPFCIGSVPRHMLMTNWIKQFFHMYPKQPKFSFLFHSEYTHGHTSKVRAADQDMLDFLSYMQNNGFLNNTLLLLMSDHGARFNSLRGTIQGKHEERMPFFSLRFPLWFQKKYPEEMKNIKTNIHRLTTPFDIHATFEDIISPGGAKAVKVNVTKRGISLLSEVPAERTCKDASIEPHWCACLNWKDVLVTDPSVVKAADTVVQKINNLTESQRNQCAKLTVGKIMNAVVYSYNPTILKHKRSKDIHGRVADLSDKMDNTQSLYQVTLQAEPSKGQFEVTVTRYDTVGVYSVSEKDISRINKYGEDPHCITTKLPHLRPYCFCV